MIQLNFSPAKCSQDELVKQQAAQKQMRELLQRLAGGVKYRVLTQSDRSTLLKEGFARELVDNLIYLTLGREDNRKQDQQVSGFTLAALDPSLYGSESILRNVQKINSGCCSYCESFLLATGEGSVQHFRPPSQIQKQDSILPSPYLPMAYAQDNLLYSCKACHEQYKRFKFPVKGPRFPEVAIEQEKALVINPYLENPRNFIRFNPLNGQAYPYDLVVKYYQECHGMSTDDIETTLWGDPQCIPLMAKLPGSSLESGVDSLLGSKSDNKTISTPSTLPKTSGSVLSPKSSENLPPSYSQWLAKQDTQQANSCGAVSIACLGLNRAALIDQRIAMLGQIWLDFSHTLKDKTIEGANIKTLSTHQYRSLAIDAYHSWQQGVTNKKEKIQLSTLEKIQAKLPRLNKDKIDLQSVTPIPMWLASSLLYFVPEDELALTGKRRLVVLLSQDKYYGKGYDHKCIFLDIDWDSITENIIKVRDETHTWETSFSELALSREIDVYELFSNNEVWVEGAFSALN
jgi:hypothetical protein